MGKSTISMVIFNSKLLVYQAGYIHVLYLWKPFTSYNPWDDPDQKKQQTSTKHSESNSKICNIYHIDPCQVKYVVL